jgi:hypothetical protein
MNNKLNGWWGHLVQFLSVAVIVIGATLYLQNALHDIDARLVAMEILVADRWTRTDMELWTNALIIANDAEGLRVPAVPPSRPYKERR